MTPTFTKPVRVNYLQNATLLQEIHRSKVTYSYFIDTRYQDFDLIAATADDITPKLIEKAKVVKAERETRRLRTEARAQGIKQSSAAYRSLKVEPSDYTIIDVTFRVMTFDHVPLAPERKAKPKTVADQHVACNFPPFKHYAYDDAGDLREVGRSHWVGGFDNGHFSASHGRMTNRLGKAFQLLTERYGTRGNFRGYSYLEEMKSEALMQLCQHGLKFDESRSDNPFSYFTVITNNAFIKVLNAEKKQANIRDDELERNGQTPSMARQLRNEGR